ncbi:hypothetical protein BOX15_Mlig026280g2 [Macrostomum lignano]|uniref:RRM domain-containing protein n=1 Tax=Macrostomum lignano TaxID=282301 RepID=A0A267DX55_9PLAT|nr:hypothetical protein BOX15_Mlig026280g2 [Macrostomum lignano]
MSGGTVLIRLQNLAWSANASDIRRFFNGLAIPEGGVHIVGGDRGDAFVTFTSDETARLALLLDGQELCGQTLKLFVSSNAEMQHVVQQVRLAAVAPAEEPQPPTTPTPPPLREQPNQGLFEHSAGYRAEATDGLTRGPIPESASTRRPMPDSTPVAADIFPPTLPSQPMKMTPRRPLCHQRSGSVLTAARATIGKAAMATGETAAGEAAEEATNRPPTAVESTLISSSRSRDIPCIISRLGLSNGTATEPSPNSPIGSSTGSRISSTLTTSDMGRTTAATTTVATALLGAGLPILAEPTRKTTDIAAAATGTSNTTAAGTMHNRWKAEKVAAAAALLLMLLRLPRLLP